jgi:hypothetical protein
MKDPGTVTIPLNLYIRTKLLLVLQPRLQRVAFRKSWIAFEKKMALEFLPPPFLSNTVPSSIGFLSTSETVPK